MKIIGRVEFAKRTEACNVYEYQIYSKNFDARFTVREHGFEPKAHYNDNVIIKNFEFAGIDWKKHKLAGYGNIEKIKEEAQYEL